MSRFDFTPGTKRYFIAEFANRGVSWQDTFAALRPKVLQQEKPWIFSANPPRGSGSETGRKRTPKEIPAQLIDLKHEIRRVYAFLNRPAEDADVDTSADEIPLPNSDTAEPEAEIVPEPKRNELEFFVSEWRRIRAWIKQRATATGASPVDSLDSMRPVLEAKRAIAAGISAGAMLYAMTLHWSPETRADAGIPDADILAESDSDLLESGHHKMTGYVAKLAEARVPLYIIGPSGTGKSGMMRKLATEILDLQYADAPMSAGATPSWLLGRMTFPDGSNVSLPEWPEGMTMEDWAREITNMLAQLTQTTSYKISHFLKCYTEGGVFVFEEIDAADPNMLLVVNNALAIPPGDEFFNPVNGLSYVRHTDFIAGATANTFGLGANTQYTGRERLDFATIDRFRMGRVYVDLDENLVDYLVTQ
jgi:hypothetical protein